MLMKSFPRLAVLAALFISSLALASTHGHWTGIISDAKCGAKGAGNVACARKCIKAGAAYAFIADHSHATLVVRNPKMIARDLGRHVWVKGTVSGGKIQITQVRTIGQ